MASLLSTALLLASLMMETNALALPSLLQSRATKPKSSKSSKGKKVKISKGVIAAIVIAVVVIIIITVIVIFIMRRRKAKALKASQEGEKLAVEHPQPAAIPQTYEAPTPQQNYTAPPPQQQTYAPPPPQGQYAPPAGAPPQQQFNPGQGQWGSNPTY